MKRTCMEQKDHQAGDANILSNSSPLKIRETTEHANQNNEVVPPGHTDSRVRPGHVVARIQAARKALRNPPRNVLSGSRTAPSSKDEEVSDESVEVDALTLDVTRWIRRVLIPLALLAWAGVAILVLNAAGYVAKTLLMLVIAMLLAYALSPLVSFFARVMPRFLAILIVYLLVLGALAALLYFIVRTTVTQVI